MRFRQHHCGDVRFGSSISTKRFGSNYCGDVRCGSKLCDDVRFRYTTASCCPSAERFR
jgi:hypothetical protein